MNITTKTIVYSTNLEQLLENFPFLVDISSEKNKKKGTVVLLNNKTKRKYYIYNSGFAKAVNSHDNSMTDFINAWDDEWGSCESYPMDILYETLHKYIDFYMTFPRLQIWDYDVERKGENQKVWSSYHNKFVDYDDD